MKTTPRDYWTLCERIDGTWFPGFGDYDRSAVKFELEATGDGFPWPKRKDLKVIKTLDNQVAINQGVAKLNGCRTQGGAS